MKEQMINFLLENANPSIKYRVRAEVLGENVPQNEKDALQAQILAEPNITKIINAQDESGWIGEELRAGLDTQEPATKYLGEKLIYKDTPVLKKAMDAFATLPLTDLRYRTRGKYFDEFKYAANGQNTIRCACIARVGYDDIIDIKPQIQLAFDSFKRVLEIDSILDVARWKKVRVSKENPSGMYLLFNDYEKWPCRYHLDILAHTNSWKTEESIKTLAKALTKFMRTDRPEKQKAANSWVGYMLGTIGCYAEGFNVAREIGGVRSTILDRLEWLCRCGVAPYVDKIRKEVEIIGNSINPSGICEANIDEDQLRWFSTYSGQQLEVDWKDPVRKSCDITFRALLILHYANCT